MLDFNDLLSTPGADIKYYEGQVGTSNTAYLESKTWTKPRGAKLVYILGAGGGGGGGSGASAGGQSAGGVGGGSGAVTSVIIPATFIPDTLYIQCGYGGQGVPAQTSAPGFTVAADPTAGGTTYVTISPQNGSAPITQETLLIAPGSTGGASGSGGGIGLIANMPIAGRGFLFSVSGDNGGAGGSLADAVTKFASTFTINVGGGGGGGGYTTNGYSGAGFGAATGQLGNDFMILPVAGGTGAVHLSGQPAANGVNGFGIRNRYGILNFGGAGGGGGSSSANELPGSGGNGAPSSGGGAGGGGGGGTAPPSGLYYQAAGGNGGPGFVYIITI